MRRWRTALARGSARTVMGMTGGTSLTGAVQAVAEQCYSLEVPNQLVGTTDELIVAAAADATASTGADNDGTGFCELAS